MMNPDFTLSPAWDTNGGSVWAATEAAFGGDNNNNNNNAADVSQAVDEARFAADHTAQQSPFNPRSSFQEDNNHNSGNNNNSNNHQNMSEHQKLQARAQCEEALRMIPKEESKAYWEAREKCPHLFEDGQESDPLKFLRREDWNPWAAAKRLCFYWESRQTIFKDRWYLPVTVTGDGALTREDIMFVEAGLPAMLPARSSSGKIVMYLDRRQRPPTRDVHDRLRSAFYLFTVAAEEERSQSEGIHLLHLMTTPRLSPLEGEDENSFMRGVRIIVGAMPVKFKAYSLNFPPRSNKTKNYATQELISTFIRWAVNAGVDLENQIEILFEREEGEINSYLREVLGLPNSSVPVIAQGTWAFIEAAAWCRRRARMERERFHSVLPGSSAAASDGGSAGEAPSAEEDTKPAAKAKRGRKRKEPAKKAAKKKVTIAGPQKEDDEETRLFKKRAANVVHSRRKRERRARELQDMTEEKARLTRDQANLKAESARLEELLRRAQEMADNLDNQPNEVDDEPLPFFPTDAPNEIQFQPSQPPPEHQGFQGPVDTGMHQTGNTAGRVENNNNNNGRDRFAPLPFFRQSLPGLDDLAQFAVFWQRHRESTTSVSSIGVDHRSSITSVGE